MIPDKELADIPIERVQAAVKDLLDVDELRDVREVQIGGDVVRAVLFARDEAGHLFRDGDEVATYVLTRKVGRA